MSYNTIFANLAGSPATQPASLIDNMFNRVGQIAVVPCDTAGTNSLTLTPQGNTPPITAYTNHTPIFSTILTANSTGLVTAQVGSLASLPVFKMDAVTQLAANDLRAGRLLQLVFEGSVNGGSGGFIALQTLLPAPSGAISGVSQVKTASYTVTNNDKGSTITINNNVQTTVTFNAASGYDSDFQVRIYNGNTTAGILLSVPGMTALNNANNFLYPGQTAVIQNINGTWSLAGGQLIRWRNNQLTIFVDPVNGNDTTNDGLVNTRGLLTIQGAYNLIAAAMDTGGAPATIQLLQGTHQVGAGITFAYPLVGKGALIILGDTTSLATAANYIIAANTAGTIGFARDLSTTLFNGVSFQAVVSGITCLSASNGATIDATTCVFSGFPGGSIAGAASCGTCSIIGGAQLNGNFSAFAVASSGGFITLGGNFSIPAALTFGTFASAASCGVIDASPASFSGAGAGAGSTGTKFSTGSGGGVISGANLPGATAGTFTDTPGNRSWAV